MKIGTLRLLLLTVLCLAACNISNGQSATDSSRMKTFGNNSNSNRLLGAGSTLAYPLFSKLFAEYGKETHVMVNYQSIGSADGVLQFTNKAVDFGDSDLPLTDSQIKKMGTPVLQIILFQSTGAKDSPKNGVIEAVIYKEQNYDGRSLMRAQKLLKMLWWMVHDGQKYCAGFSYTQLSPAAVASAEKALKLATFNGKPILQ